MSPIYPTEFYREAARKWRRFEEASRRKAIASFAPKLPPQDPLPRRTKVYTDAPAHA